MRDAESYARERKNLDDVLGALNAEGDFVADRYPAVLMILAMQAQPITTQEDTVYIRGRPVQARRAAAPPSSPTRNTKGRTGCWCPRSGPTWTPGTKPTRTSGDG
jgi:hypothetical protein